MAYIHARLIVPLETCIPVFERVSRSRAWKKWKGHFSWRNFLFLSVIFLSLLSSSDFFFFPPLLFPARSIRDNVYRGIVHVGRFYRVVFGKYEGESEVEGNILCSSGGVSDERDVGQRCARRCGVKWILEIVVERTKGKSFDPRKCWSTWIGPGDLGSSWGRGKVVRCPEVGLEHRGPYRSSRTR